LKTLVLLKQVPRLRSDTPLSDDGRWIDLDKVKFDANSYDLFALEAALQLVELSNDDDSEVIVVSAGGERVIEALKSALEIGAHRGIHLAGDQFDALDASGLARMLALVCEREKPDLVLAGFMSDDGNAAAVGPMLAEYAGMAAATGIVSIEATDDGFRVERELEGGAFEVVDLTGPAVVTVQTGINEVRYPSLKAIVAARKKQIDVLSPQDLGAQTLLADVKTSIESIAQASSDSGAELLEGDTATVVAALVAKLDEWRVL
jgi:electron transfer flavoprotein beta subunit